MPRYFHKFYKRNNFLYLREFICNDIHVRADYEKNITTISKLNVILLEGTFVINTGLEFDFSNIDNLYNKLSNILILV